MGRPLARLGRAGHAAVLTEHSILFTDIEGSTRLLQRFGSAYAEMLETHHTIIRHAIRLHHGREMGNEGDAFFALFDAPGDAVGAAGTAQLALVAEPWPEGGDVRVRMGVHRGAVAETAAGLVGVAIHEAARVANAAHGGQVLATEAVVSSATLSPPYEWLDLGPHVLKDIDQPVRLHQLTHPGLAHAFPPPRSQGSGRHNLPAALTSFVGRDADLNALEALLLDNRLVTITAPGGAGKTRLAVNAAARLLGSHPGGTWFVDLAPLRGDDEVLPAIAAVVAPGLQGTPPITAISQSVGERTTLLLLDNCEHVLGGVASAATSLLATAPGVRILATSRERMGNPAEAVMPLGLLSGEDAVILFAERAQAVEPTFTLDPDSTELAGEICRQVDGLPLAIELAAARTASMALPAILGGLEKSMRLLRGRRGDDRHSTLAATIKWSYDLLDDAERALFRRLSVFVAPFGAEAATAVSGFVPLEAGDVEFVLGDLVDKSLVIRAGRTHRLLEMVRQFAESALDDAGETELVGDRHIDWAVSRAEHARPHLLDAGAVEWRRNLRPETPDHFAAIDRALETGRADAALRIVGPLWWSWMGTADLVPGIERIRLVLDAVPAQPTPEWVGAAIGGLTYSEWDRLDEANQLVEIARKLPSGSPGWYLPWAIVVRSMTLDAGGDQAGALEAANEAVAAGHRLGDPIGLGYAVGERARLLQRMQRWDEAFAGFAESIDMIRTVGNPLALGRCVGYLLFAHIEHGDDPRTYRDCAGEVLDLSRASGDDLYISSAAGALFAAALLDGDAAAAAGWLSEASEAMRNVADPEVYAETVPLLKDWALASDPSVAEEALREAASERSLAGDKQGAEICRHLAEAARAARHPDVGGVAKPTP